MKKLLILIGICICNAIPMHAQFYIYPFQSSVYKLKQLDTKYFRFIFSDSSYNDVLKIAADADEEYESMVKIYGPLKNIVSPIRVVVSRDYQLVNGLASPVGIPVIQLYSAFPPPANSVIANLGPNYLRTVFRHELTHIFTLSVKAKKTPRFDYLFGNIYHPNTIFASISLIEGVAVNRESDSGHGRLNDPYTLHHLRRDFYGKKAGLRSPASISGADTSFDTGQLPYMYGSLFYQYLTESFTPKFDPQVWDNMSQWQLSANAVVRSVKDSPTQRTRTITSLWADFENYQKGLLPSLEDLPQLLSNRKRRITSLTIRGDVIYYYDSRKREFRSLKITTGKDRLVLHGAPTWDTVHVSPDQKMLIVSGTVFKKRIARVFTSILDIKTGIPISPIFYGLKEASFSPEATRENPEFTAVRIDGKNPMTLVHYSQGVEKLVLSGSDTFYFDTPKVYQNYIYMLSSINGTRQLMRVRLDGTGMEFLNHSSVNYPRFLNDSPTGLSFAYTDSKTGIYKTALLSRQNIVLITNNVKGEMLRSVFNDGKVYVQGSFGDNDNISRNTSRQGRELVSSLVFRPIASATIANTALSPDNFTTPKRYRQSIDLLPYFWAPYASFTEAGIQTVLFDPIGANTITFILGFEYFQGVPQFRFNWVHSSLPVDFFIGVQNIYFHQVNVPNLAIVVSTGFQVPFNTAFAGSGSLTARLSWLGRFIGPADQHPFLWTNMAVQQLIVDGIFRWNYIVSEGEPNFERSVRLDLRSAVNTFNTAIWRIESALYLSPPIIPIFFNFYTVYDLGGVVPSGSSMLGSSIIPVWNEFANLTRPSDLVFFTSIDLLTVPGEINRGIEMGEIFLQSINIFTGYRAGWWSAYGFLQSVYIRLDINLSVVYGKLALSFSQDFAYAITQNSFSYSFRVNTGLPF
ncbi:MAG: hypothetical protein ACRCY4_01500 [Brevinema sp.]